LRRRGQQGVPADKGWNWRSHQNHFRARFGLLADVFSEQSPNSKAMKAAAASQRLEAHQQRQDVVDTVQRVLHVGALASRTEHDGFSGIPGKQRLVGEVAK
jgi:hypothetical protein